MIVYVVGRDEQQTLLIAVNVIDGNFVRHGTTSCNVPSITRVNFQNFIEILTGTNRTISCEIRSETPLNKDPIWNRDYPPYLPTENNVESAPCSNSTSKTCIVSNLTLINVVQGKYNGSYKITAENDCGNTTVSVFINIVVPPHSRTYMVPTSCVSDHSKPPQLEIPPPLVAQTVQGMSATIKATYIGNSNDKSLLTYWCQWCLQTSDVCHLCIYPTDNINNYKVTIDDCVTPSFNCCRFTIAIKIEVVTLNLSGAILVSVVCWQQNCGSYSAGNSTLVVNIRPTLDKTLPVAYNQCVELNEGQSTEFTCIYNASTNPDVTITTWKFNNRLLKHNSSHYTMTTEYDSDHSNLNRVLSRLRLLNVIPDNTGTFTCQCAFISNVIDEEVVSEAASFCLKVKPGKSHIMVAVVLPIVLSVLLVVMIVLIYKGRKTIRLICKRQSKLTPPQDADQLLSKNNLGMPSGAAYGSTVPIRGTGKPTMKLLNQYSNRVASQWRELGRELLKEESLYKLNNIESNHPRDVERCCSEMFENWIGEDAEASWNKLIYALKQIGQDVLAMKISRDVLKETM